jgi:bile acid:Na+ symporter, BASS family
LVIAFLTFCGRRGTQLLAVGFFIGIAVPPLAALLRPLLSTFVFLLTASTMLGLDWRALVGYVRRPLRLSLVIAWTMLGAPVAMAVALRYIALPQPLASALVLWAASPPLMSLPAIAMLLGLDADLALLTWVLGAFLMPLTLPPLALGLIGVPLAIGIVPLMGHLALFVGSAAALAVLAHWFLGAERIAANRLAVSGLNVVLLLLFCVAVMDGMTARLRDEPLDVLLYALATIIASGAFQGLSALVFIGFERRTALTAGLIGGNHNIAMLWAALPSADAASLLMFFAVVQLPIFVLPAFSKPLYRRLAAGPRSTLPAGQ